MSQRLLCYFIFVCARFCLRSQTLFIISFSCLPYTSFKSFFALDIWIECSNGSIFVSYMNGSACLFLLGKRCKFLLRSTEYALSVDLKQATLLSNGHRFKSLLFDSVNGTMKFVSCMWQQPEIQIAAFIKYLNSTSAGYRFSTPFHYKCNVNLMWF